MKYNIKKIVFLILIFVVGINTTQAKVIKLKKYNISNEQVERIQAVSNILNVAQTLDEQQELEEEIKLYTRGINDAINSFPLDRCMKLEDSDAAQCQNMVQTLKNRVSLWNTKVNDSVNKGYFSGQNIVIENYREAANKANEIINKMEQVLGNNSDNNSDNKDVNIDFKGLCEKEGIHKTVKFLGSVLYIIKIIVPILLIIFGTIDFVKSMISSNQDALQKSSKVLIIRIVAGIIIFLLPTIINYVFKIVGNDESAFSECRICILDVRNCD